MDLRRQFDLLPDCLKFLQEYECDFETIIDGSMWLLLHGFRVPKGYNHERVLAAVRIESGYPDTALDMVYVYPALVRVDGVPIGRTEATQAIDGKTFQRWSRHRTPENPWKPGKDDLASHIFLIEDWLEREFEKCPPR